MWAVATLGGILGLGFLYLRRIDTGGMVRAFGWAWLAFFASLVFSASHPSFPPLAFFAHVLGTAFPALLAAAAFHAADRPTPRWILPVGLVVGAVRGVAFMAGVPLAADGLAWVFEAGFDFYGAAIVFQAFRADRRRVALRALAVAMTLFGVLEITNTFLITSAGIPYAAFGTVATLALAFSQILVALEAGQVRRRQAELRRTEEIQALRRIARAASQASELEGVAAEALAALRTPLALDAGAIWLLAGSGERFEALHSFGLDEEMPPDVRLVDVDEPQTRLTLEAPLIVDDAERDERALHRYTRIAGFRRIAFLTIGHADETLGILAAARREGEPFDPTDQAFLEAATGELALAIGHAAAVARLDAQHRILRSVVDTAPVGVLVEDAERAVQLTNERLEAHLGLASSPASGSAADAVFLDAAARSRDPRAVTALLSDVRRGPPDLVSETALTLSEPEGRELLLFSGPVVSAHGDARGRVWVTRDASQEHALAEQLRQSRKMETLGTLASGIAHDFNNQLTAILGNAANILEELQDRPAARSALYDLERAAEHCTELTRSLLDFARKTPGTREPVSLVEVVEDVVAMLQPLLPAGVQLEAALPDEPMVAIADATQIRQLLINLVVNARDAVASAGRIGVELRLAAGGEGRAAELLVVDDGCGMDAATREQVFEPFYTTKGPGGGTGLGLAVAYGAVQAHGGRIDVETAPGQGTTFRVWLPLAEAAALAPWDEAASLEAREGETILVADDELVVRRLVRVALERHGYKVVEVASGEEAVACFAEDPEGIDLAVLDLTMPGLDGLATLERLRTWRSGLPAVVMSGLLGAGPSFPVPDAVGLLPKPFSADEMARVIRARLDAAGDGRRAGEG